MTTNYPPGMTREDWKHIDGAVHHPLCTMHEEFVHDCWPNAKHQVVPVPDGGRTKWALIVSPATRGAVTVPIDFCPYCGVDLGPVECICQEIDETLKAEAAERKAAT